MKSINEKMVAIENLSLEEPKSKLEKSETTIEQEMKKQNLGVVKMVGEGVPWPKVGMTVKYLRHASTPLEDIDNGNKEYQIVNKAHVLAEFETVKSKK